MRRSTKNQSDVSLVFIVGVSGVCTFYRVLYSSCVFLSYLQISCCLDADQVFVQPWYFGCIFRNHGSLQTSCTNVPSLRNLESFVRTPFVGRAFLRRNVCNQSR